MRVALTIAGSDPSGGAGIQADLKTFERFGVYGMAALTALTAQNTRGVAAVHTVPAEFLRAQLRMLNEDVPPHALKTGMLANSELVQTVAASVREYQWAPLVVDPVMVATSGDRLLTPEAEQVIATDLLPLAAVVTPNLDEATLLTGRLVSGTADMEAAGRLLLEMGAGAVLMKGGHLPGDLIVDLLVTPAGVRRFEHPRVKTGSTHGTGCRLSAAIAAGLALGEEMEPAVERGIRHVVEWLGA